MDFDDNAGLDSSQVDDRRGMSRGGLAVGGGAVGIVGLLIALFFGDFDRGTQSCRARRPAAPLRSHEKHNEDGDPAGPTNNLHGDVLRVLEDAGQKSSA